MAVITEDNRVSLVTNGLDTVFPFNFTTFEPDHIRCFFLSDEDAFEGFFPSEVVGGFTVSVSGDDQTPGGEVTFGTAPIDGVLTIVRELPVEQTLVLDPAGRFPSKSVERTFDKNIMLIQQILNRAVLAPLNDVEGVDYTLPNYDPGKVMVWDNDFKRLKNVPLPQSFEEALIQKTNLTEFTVSGFQRGFLYWTLADTPITVTLGSAGGEFAGETVYFLQGGLGQITFVGDSGVNVISADLLDTRAQFSVVAAIRLDAQNWTLAGDLGLYA